MSTLLSPSRTGETPDSWQGGRVPTNLRVSNKISTLTGFPTEGQGTVMLRNVSITDWMNGTSRNTRSPVRVRARFRKGSRSRIQIIQNGQVGGTERER